MAATKQPENIALESRDAPPLTVRAAVVPSSIDEEKRTIEVTWSTGAEVARRDWYSGARYVEALSMDAKHIRLDRLNSGAPVLDSHSSYRVGSVLGVVESAKVEKKQGVATIRFSERAEVEPVWQDIRSGILRNISVGYAVHKWQVERGEGEKIEKRTAVDWEPFELSIVPIPADAGAQVRAYEDDAQAPEAEQTENLRAHEGQETEAMSAQRTQPEQPTAPAAAPQNTPSADEVRALERKRVTAIDELCRVHGIEDAQRTQWLSDDVSVDSVRAAILDKLAERQRANTVSPITSGDGQREQSMVRDATSALLRRAGEKVEGDGHRNFGDGSLLRMAETVLAAGGVNTRTLGRDELAKRALTTSDFTSILAAAGEKLVRAGYESVQPVHRLIFRKTTAADFRTKNRIVVAAGSILPEVPENGVIQRAGAKAEMASYALKSFAAIVAITRKMIINDDFDFVASVSRQRGRSALETERNTVWDFVASNPPAPNGNFCFDNTNHGNYPAASGTPITATTLAAARTALRKAQSPDGFAINAELAHVVVGTAGEVDFDQLLNGMYVPTAAGSAVTPRMRSVQLYVEPLVHATKKHWYGFADYNQVDTFEFAYLAGNEGPRVEQRNGFDVEGVELKVALDFGVGLIDHRGCYYQRET